MSNGASGTGRSRRSAMDVPWSVVAGVVIGVANEWNGVILVPFIWGVIWCVYSTFRGDYRKFIEGWKLTVGNRRIREAGVVYFIREYFIAVLTATGVAIAAKLIVDLFR